jgi:hypothetical protein
VTRFAAYAGDALTLIPTTIRVVVTAAASHLRIAVVDIVHLTSASMNGK